MTANCTDGGLPGSPGTSGSLPEHFRFRRKSIRSSYKETLSDQAVVTDGNSFNDNSVLGRFSPVNFLRRSSSVESLEARLDEDVNSLSRSESCQNIAAGVVSLTICRCDDCLLEITDTWADLILWKDRQKPSSAGDEKPAEDDLRFVNGEFPPTPPEVPFRRTKSLGDVRTDAKNRKNGQRRTGKRESNKESKELRSLPANILETVEKHDNLVRKPSGWRKVRNMVQWAPFIQRFKDRKYQWVQLAGHSGNFKAGKCQGTVLKKTLRPGGVLLQTVPGRRHTSIRSRLQGYPGSGQ